MGSLQPGLFGFMIHSKVSVAKIKSVQALQIQVEFQPRDKTRELLAARGALTSPKQGVMWKVIIYIYAQVGRYHWIKTLRR